MEGWNGKSTGGGRGSESVGREKGWEGRKGREEKVEIPTSTTLRRPCLLQPSDAAILHAVYFEEWIFGNVFDMTSDEMTQDILNCGNHNSQLCIDICERSQQFPLSWLRVRVGSKTAFHETSSFGNGKNHTWAPAKNSNSMAPVLTLRAVRYREHTRNWVSVSILRIRCTHVIIIIIIMFCRNSAV